MLTHFRSLKRLALLVFLALPAEHSALAADPPTLDVESVLPLLAPVEAVTRSTASADPTIVRRRTVVVDHGLLDELAIGTRASFEFNLFAGITVVAEVSRVDRTSPGRLTLSGSLRDHRGSSFLLVARDGAVIASLSSPDLGSYEIRFVGSGLHEVRKIAPSNFLPCGTDELPQPKFDPQPPQPVMQAGACGLDDGSQIDVLVVYTEKARLNNGGLAGMDAFIAFVESQANLAYANSEITTRVQIVGSLEVDYIESGSGGTDLVRLSRRHDGYLDEVHSLRDDFEADLVALLVNRANACGVAWFAVGPGNTPRPTLGFSTTAISSCPVVLAVFAHELGHNQGCLHDRAASSSDFGAFLYSHGHYVPEAPFRTIMATSCGSDSCPKADNFSNPDILYHGFPTGVPVGEPDSANNALTINNTAFNVASFRQSGDCNNNGICDEQEIASGQAEDCNGNGRPDDCDRDCNANGFPDTCDIAAGTSTDCNENAIPDECDPDCNASGFPDTCDIASGTSLDCDGNAIPDECDPDCNANGFPDPCDIESGTSIDCNLNATPDECEPDCNGNGQADECDITQGLSTDCDTNGVPDECDPDCDGNGQVDACDIAQGLVADCDANGIPDDCELAENDCDGNGVVDDCDPDCNGNGVPDECELAENDCDGNGVVDDCDPDCNGNGVADECELAGNDCDGNGVLDECDPDCNHNGVADGCELLDNDCNLDGVPDECGALLNCPSFERQKLIASDAADLVWFGESVSVSGDIAVVGAYLSDCTAGGDCGSAYVYRFNGSSWIEVQKLTASDAAADDEFGRSVSVSGDIAVVGAYQRGCAGGVDDCGAAYVYRFNGSSWIEVQKLTASDSAFGDNFGRSVSVSGGTIIVGAPRDKCAAGNDCGAAYIYRFDGSSWFEIQKLTASDAGDDWFGFSVFINGDIAVVGAYRHDCAAGGDCGSAYVFRFSGSGWIEEQKLTAADAAPDDFFGFSVSLGSNTIVVGASQDDCPAEGDCGSAYVYRFNGSTWVEEQRLAASDAAAGNRFGHSASISGGTIVIGNDHDTCDGGGSINCGSAYVYRFDGSSWMEKQKLTASRRRIHDRLGASVSVSGNNIILGAAGAECAAGVACGSAFMFDLRGPDCDCNGEADACDLADTTNVDCNNNGVVDECDIESEFSTDLNGDGIPDECQDCQPNGTPDDIDLASGSSADCDEDGVPDECQADCNATGQPEACDLADGTSQDCNVNNVPDECDITAGTSVDLNGDVIPDECQDCNQNGIPDPLDIADGASLDCNLNSLPDECELENNDCDANGIPDECDPDCNGNGVADGCDIAQGLSTDCDTNGVPDECDPDCNGNEIADACDIEARTSADCNGNGIPDECDGSSNGVPCLLPNLQGAAIQRFISFVVPPRGAGNETALRVTLVSLYDPADPQPDNQPDFSGSEGEVRYVNLLRDENGNPVTTCVDSAARGTSYRCATVGCNPQYADWAGLLDGEPFYISGSAIIPDSVYSAAQLAASCTGSETTCTAVSTALALTTARYGDVDDTGTTTVADVVLAVDAVKQLAGSAFEYQVYIRKANPAPQFDATGVGDIVAHVDALKLFAYQLPVIGCP